MRYCSASIGLVSESWIPCSISQEVGKFRSTYGNKNQYGPDRKQSGSELNWCLLCAHFWVCGPVMSLHRSPEVRAQGGSLQLHLCWQ